MATLAQRKPSNFVYVNQLLLLLRLFDQQSHRLAHYALEISIALIHLLHWVVLTGNHRSSHSKAWLD